MRSRWRFPFRLCQAILLLSGWWVAFALWSSRDDVEQRVVPVPAPSLPEVSAVERAFAEWAEDPSLAGAAVAFCVLDDEGDVLFASPLAETTLAPASALKTLTTGAALGVLGVDFRFETSLIGKASLDADGVLKGDLVLLGGGDPTLSLEDLDALASSAVAKGLRRVKGRLKKDASIFPANPMSDYWNWGDIGNAYGVGAFGLNVEHNRIMARFAPGRKMGEPADFVRVTPALAGVKVINHVVTGPQGSGDQVVAYSQPYGGTLTFRGSVPLDEPVFEVSAAIPDPPTLALERLRTAPERHGVPIDGETMAAGDVDVSVELAKHRSAPLTEIIEHLHRVSDNLEAQCLFLMIGRERGLKPAEAVRRYWQQAGVGLVGLRLLDGSGLARATMIRPLDLAAVNHAARTGPHGDFFLKSLSAYDGGQVRSKRGYMSGVRTEVGFFRAADGSERIFSLVVNGLPAGVNFANHRDALLAAARVVKPSDD